MAWKTIKDGYEFNLHFKQGSTDSCTLETLRCSLSESDFLNTVKVLSHLGDAIEKNVEKCTEDVALYIEQKTGIKQSEVMTMIVNFIKEDIEFSSRIARLSHVEVFRHENGQVKHDFLDTISFELKNSSPTERPKNKF